MRSPFFLSGNFLTGSTRMVYVVDGATSFTLMINAGGQSRRMGRNKALLPVPPDDTPLLALLLARLANLGPAQVGVISDDPAVARVAMDQDAVTILRDAYPGQGPLSGIATALAAADGWVMLLACDMPLLDPAVLAFLLAQADDGWDAVVPHVDGRFQTMHALYHRRCLPAVEAAMARGDRRAVAFYDAVRVRTVDEATYTRVDPARRSLANVNTPEEWAAILPQVVARRSGAG